MKAKLISLIEFVSKYGNFNYEPVIQCSRNDYLQLWTTYYLELTVVMQKHIDNNGFDGKICFVDHWKKNTYGWCVIENLYDAYIFNLQQPLSNGLKTIISFECKYEKGDFNDNEIMVYYF